MNIVSLTRNKAYYVTDKSGGLLSQVYYVEQFRHQFRVRVLSMVHNT